MDTSANHIDSGKSELPFIAAIVVSMSVWLALIWAAPIVVLATTVLMVLLGTIQSIVAPWLVGLWLPEQQAQYPV